MTDKNPENMNGTWNKIFSYGFGGVGVGLSLLTILLVFIWLLSADGGGLGSRGHGADYFNWHPFLMSCAFLLFMTPATSAFEVCACCSSRHTNKLIHGALQSLAMLSITAGYIIIYDCHTNLSNTGLAKNMHSIAGYLTIAMVGLTYLMGFYLYAMKCGGTLRGELKPFHKRLGMMSLFMGFATMLMGWTENAVFGGLKGHHIVFPQVIVGLLIGTAVSVGFSIIKFVDKKDKDYSYYDSSPDAGNTNDVDFKVQLL
eukprot:352287_1